MCMSFYLGLQSGIKRRCFLQVCESCAHNLLVLAGAITGSVQVEVNLMDPITAAQKSRTRNWRN